MYPKLLAMLRGGQVPGKIPPGPDDEKHDTQKALLTPGEVVVPKSIAQGPNPEKEAGKFVKMAALMAALRRRHAPLSR